MLGNGLNVRCNMRFTILIILFTFISCGVRKDKIYGIYQTDKNNVRQLVLNLKPDNSYNLLLEASMISDSIYGNYIINNKEVVLFCKRKADELNVFDDSVKVNIINNRKLEILYEILKKQ